jgi:hypothetical protein
MTSRRRGFGIAGRSDTRRRVPPRHDGTQVLPLVRSTSRRVARPLRDSSLGVPANVAITGTSPMVTHGQARGVRAVHCRAHGSAVGDGRAAESSGGSGSSGFALELTFPLSALDGLSFLAPAGAHSKNGPPVETVSAASHSPRLSGRARARRTSRWGKSLGLARSLEGRAGSANYSCVVRVATLSDEVPEPPGHLAELVTSLMRNGFTEIYRDEHPGSFCSSIRIYERDPVKVE